MKINDFPNIVTVADADLLLVQTVSDQAYKNIKFSDLKQYFAAASNSGSNSNTSNANSSQPALDLPSTGLISKFYAGDINTQGHQGELTLWLDTVSHIPASPPGTGMGPILIPKTFGSINGIYFDGSKYLNTNLSYLANTFYSIVVVDSRDTVLSNMDTFFVGCDNRGTNQTVFAGYANDSTFRFGQYANDLDANIPGYTKFQPTIWVASHNSRGHEIWRNNTLISSNSNTDHCQNANNGTIGRGLFANYKGYLGLIATYTGDKSSTDIQAIFSAVNTIFKVY